MTTHGKGILIPVNLARNVHDFKLRRLPPRQRRGGIDVYTLSLEDVLDYWDALHAPAAPREGRAGSAQA